MIPKECKRLAEVDFPIAVVSAHSAREKSIRHGHPSTLHLWWARRPLAACRAMLLALLLPDPCDENCPTDFKEEARALLPQVMGKVGQASSLSETQAGRLSHDLELRNALLRFIGDFANWDNAAKPRYLAVGRGLVKAAHGDTSGMMPEPPLVVDPFAGGGSIPLEALRLGCDAFASDLNPVACLILKVMLEDIPRHGPELADELRKVGGEIKQQAEKELAQYYPRDPDGATPIAYLWARTVRCESSNCGAEIPLMRSFWLCEKVSRLRALRYVVVRNSGAGFPPVNPWKSPDLAARARNLPHLETPQATYFVTFRCRDRRFLATDAARDAAMSAIRHWDDHRIDLDAAVVMPDHAHLMFRIVDGSDLSSILHSIKSFSAKQIGKFTGSRGSVWQDESFDHIIRHETEWEEKLEYVRLNPVTRGLVDSSQDYQWLYVKSHRQDACATGETGSQPQIVFEVFTPKSEKEVAAGTVTRAKATCLACERVLAPDRVRAQLREQRGGADTIFEEKKSGTGILPVRVGGARLLAVVTLGGNTGRMPVPLGRQYRVATERDYEAAWNAQKAVAKLAKEKLPNGLSVIPDEPTPWQRGHRAVGSPRIYGMTRWGDLFTGRQRLSLATLSRYIAKSRFEPKTALVPILSRCADYWSSAARWVQNGEFVADTFARQALAMVWDFAETAPWAGASGSFDGALSWVASVIESWPHSSAAGQVQIADARDFPLPDDSSRVWFTDPPYYDAVPYADISDFFFVWLKRALPERTLFRDPFDSLNTLTPKRAELTVTTLPDETSRPKDRQFFEEGMSVAFAEGRRQLNDAGIACVVFAHKSTEGWESLLSGLINGGWVMTSSWPVSTERGTRLNAQETASLATSIHLVCRPRPEDAPVGDWGDVLRELPVRIGDWMEHLSAEGLRGADLVFACIGPAMEVYSRYSKVEDAEGREIPLGGNPEATEPHQRGFLAYVWEIVGRTALQQVLGTAEARARNGAAGALEEDARLTALFLWTLQSTSSNGTGFQPVNSENEEAEADDEDTGRGAGATGNTAKKGPTLIYDVVRRFSQPLGIHLETWDDRIIETRKGLVRLLPVKERAARLLGEDGASGVAEVIERNRSGPLQYSLPGSGTGFQPVRAKGRNTGRHATKAKSSDEAPTVAPGTTTLDRVHIAMLLQASGKANALRTMLKAEVERGPDFLRLANALSALYPRESEEKRLLDAMLLAAPK